MHCRHLHTIILLPMLVAQTQSAEIPPAKPQAVAPAPFTDVPVKASRENAWSPEETRKSIELDGPYEVQIVAAEPLVRDPVEMTWDAQGRCYVADMIDYPLGPEPGQPPLSRIQQLIDENGDGTYDRAITFADHMDHVQGLLPYKDGLIATTRTQILFVRDTNGDGIADERKPLIEGFNPSHSQLQVSSPRWGLDNCVYFNNGLDTREIYSSDSSGSKQNLARSNFRWDPATGKIEPTSGYGQYGGGFDDWGRHFFSSNRSPVMFAVMPHEAVGRNPHAGIAQGWEDIAPNGANTRVYPLLLTHTTADAHAGTHTAACGLGVYRGDLMPELRGEIFVADPTGQLVVRYHPEPKGASLKASRVGEHTEFFRSRDEWCRPVNITTGPDGALYICDIYRRYIDHARFFPENFGKTHDMRAGENEGRIWRIVPKGIKARPISPAPQTAVALLQWLGHENAWQRETAQRLLIEGRGDVSKESDRVQDGLALDPLLTVHIYGWKLGDMPNFTTGASGIETYGIGIEDLQQNARVKDPRRMELILTKAATSLPHIDRKLTARVAQESPRNLMLYLLSLAGTAGNDPEKIPEEPVLTCARALETHPDDVWIHRAVLSSASGISGQILASYLELTGDEVSFSEEKSAFVRALASCSAADSNREDFGRLLSVLQRKPGELLWWKPALLQGIAEGLPKSEGKLRMKSLAGLMDKSATSYRLPAAEIRLLLAAVDKVMLDPAAPLEQRLATIPLLTQRSWEQAEPVMRALLADGQPAQVVTAALTLLKKFSAEKAAPLLYELLPKLGPAPRLEIVKMLTGNAKTVREFFERIDRGELPKAFVDAETRWRYLRPNQPMHNLAVKIFGSPSTDRAAVMTNYTDSVTLKGDATKGHQIFSTVCIACHRRNGEGVDVGPDITDVRIKEKEALLSDILDPNRMVEARWMAYQIDTKDSRTISGLIASETPAEVTVKMAGGLSEVIPRTNISKMKSLDTSLMPAGLEAGISKEQMADLLAFLKGE